MSLAGCEKLKEMTGADSDNAKTVTACKSVSLGMKTSEMRNIMGNPVYERDATDGDANLRHFMFSSSAAVKAAVIISVDKRNDSVVAIQCDETYIKGTP